VKRRAAVAAIAGPEADARTLVAVGLLHDPEPDIGRLAARQRRRGAAGEARHREIERAPEEMHRAHFAEIARAEHVEDAIRLHELAPERLRGGGVIARVRAVLARTGSLPRSRPA